MYQYLCIYTLFVLYYEYHVFNFLYDFIYNTCINLLLPGENGLLARLSSGHLWTVFCVCVDPEEAYVIFKIVYIQYSYINFLVLN